MRLWPTELLLWLAGLGLASGARELYILLDEPHLQKCRGVAAAVSAHKRDVHIRDSAGRKAYFVKAPGTYSINFDNIQVSRNLGRLSGDISARIQVPLDTGIGLRFDLPYQAIPETGLLSSRCDAQSRVVEISGRQYCRYCDLCASSQELKRRLGAARHKFVEGVTEADSLDEICTEIEGGRYELHRELRIPSPEELERIAKEKFDVDRLSKDLKDRLERKRGRLQVEVRVMSSESRPSRVSKAACPFCCDTTAPCYAEWENQLRRFLACSRPGCRPEATQCLPSDAQLIGCSIAEFQYQITEDIGEVRRFLLDHGIDESVLDPPPPPPKALPAPNPRPSPTSFGKRPRTSRPRPRPRPQAGRSPSEERCLAKLAANPRTRVHARICKTFFASKRAFCCARCQLCQ